MSDPIDFTGRKVNKWTIIRYVGISNHKKPLRLWECQCECGTIKNFPSTYFNSGLIRSCGCNRHKIDRDNDIIGKKYNRLIVLDFEFKKNGFAYYKCRCECGEIRIVSKISILEGKTKSCGCIARGKSSKNWKGYGDIGKFYVNRVKSNAKKRKIEFNITIEYMWELFLYQDKKCAITKLELKFDSKSNNGDGTASLDRIDSSKGYVEGNVQWVHKDINFMKRNYDQDRFIKMCKLVAQNN